MKLVSTMHATNVKWITESTEAAIKFGRFFMGKPWNASLDTPSK